MRLPVTGKALFPWTDAVPEIGQPPMARVILTGEAT